MNNLFPDIYSSIAQELDTKSLIKLAETNKKNYNNIVNNKLIWLNKLKNKFNYIPKNPPISCIEIYKELASRNRKIANSSKFFAYIKENSVICKNSDYSKSIQLESSNLPINIIIGSSILLILTKKGILQVHNPEKSIEYIEDCLDMDISRFDEYIVLKKNNSVVIYTKNIYIDENISKALSNDRAKKIVKPDFINMFYILCKSGRILSIEIYNPLFLPKEGENYGNYYFYNLAGEKFIQIISYKCYCLALTNKKNLYILGYDFLYKIQEEIIYISCFNNIITAITINNTIKYKYPTNEWFIPKYEKDGWREFTLPKLENDMILQVMAYNKAIIGLSIKGKLITLKSNL